MESLSSYALFGLNLWCPLVNFGSEHIFSVYFELFADDVRPASEGAWPAYFG